MAPPPKKSADDEWSKKLDLCLADGVVKTGTGLMLGGLTSLLFFRRRRWPWIMGMGMGAGIAYANCEFSLNAAVAMASVSNTKQESS